MNELLEKPEILSYLRRKGIEKDRHALYMRLYRGLCSGRITKEVVMEYMQESVSPPKPELPERLL